MKSVVPLKRTVRLKLLCSIELHYQSSLAKRYFEVFLDRFDEEWCFPGMNIRFGTLRCVNGPHLPLTAGKLRCEGEGPTAAEPSAALRACRNVR